jgi:2-amino-4-hydroxy-6-hydroxymethyldihydropteridine diphosphokinase
VRPVESDTTTVPTVYLALGSNLGDRAGNLRQALEALPPAFRVEAVSSVYETEPMYLVAQPKFLNMVCRTQTVLLPHDALQALKLLERSLGREPAIRFGPRRIDLDILFYADLVLETPDLVLPHPRLHERAFVLVPLAELDPDLVHPKLNQTAVEMRDALGDAVKSARPIGDLNHASSQTN